MAFLGMFTYKSKSGETYYLHSKQISTRTLYYFSKEMADALPAVPMGREVFENPRTGLPMLRKKKTPWLFDLVGGEPAKKKEE